MLLTGSTMAVSKSSFSFLSVGTRMYTLAAPQCLPFQTYKNVKSFRQRWYRLQPVNKTVLVTWFLYLAIIMRANLSILVLCAIFFSFGRARSLAKMYLHREAYKYIYIATQISGEKRARINLYAVYLDHTHTHTHTLEL